MIELDYFPDGVDGVVYQVLQFRAGEPWRIVYAGELIWCMEKLDGLWYVKGKVSIPQELIEGIGGLIDQQHFNRLPMEIKIHWKAYLQEVIAQGDRQYLVVCKTGIDFERFERLFRAYIMNLVRDPWEICFRVYDAEMSEDFEVVVKGSMLVY
jgi:hypothetical protein